MAFVAPPDKHRHLRYHWLKVPVTSLNHHFLDSEVVALWYEHNRHWYLFMKNSPLTAEQMHEAGYHYIKPI